MQMTLRAFALMLAMLGCVQGGGGGEEAGRDGADDDPQRLVAGLDIDDVESKAGAPAS